MHYKRLKFLYLGALCVLAVNGFCLTIFAQPKPTVRVSAEKTVDREIVKLGDLAEVLGDEGKTARLKAVSLGFAPNVGALREIRIEQLRLAIAAAGFADGEIVLEAPAKILIRRAGQAVSQDQLRQSVEKFFAEKFSSDRIEARIVRLELPEIPPVPTGTIEIRPNFSVIQNYFQPFALAVEIRVDGKVFRRVSAAVEIEAFAEILVAAKDLAAGQKLAEADLRPDKRRIVKPLANYLREGANFRGLALIKNIAGGAELTTDSIVSSVVVKTGDRVNVEARSGTLKIMISGEARAAGRIGDRIAVKNLQSGSILQATVVDEGQVRILF
jgi:flagella basal body P-ring formation protein FlgA